MKWGDFREYFSGFAWKRLTAHEVDPSVSNGHEFQGVGGLRKILGKNMPELLTAKYVLLDDEADSPEVLSSTAKWYDARANNPERSSEWRLYYPNEAGAVQSRMHAGDLMVIGVTQKRELLILLAKAGSERESQLRVLFGIDDDGLGAFRVRSLDEPIAMDFVAMSILEQLGIADAHLPVGGDAGVVADLVEELIAKDSAKLPTGDSIARLIRERIAHPDPLNAPDDALFRWIEAEAAMYRGWEDRKIANRIRAGFFDAAMNPDIAGFRQFSMSIRQSRVSRAGGALQYHFRALLEARGVQYVMEPVIDRGEIPDFLFPSKAAYLDAVFPAERLRMLAAKFTAKDRWRQVLNEAERIRHKHLLTMEAAISANQMSLMSHAKLTLVIPAAIRQKYPSLQRGAIMTVNGFLDELAALQK